MTTLIPGRKRTNVAAICAQNAYRRPTETRKPAPAHPLVAFARSGMRNIPRRARNLMPRTTLAAIASAMPANLGELLSGGGTLRTAIIHYWIVAERGGEKVVRALCDLFPDAVIFTHVADRDLVARLYPGHEIRTTFISRLPFAQKQYQRYLPLMPLALEELDLSEFDLVLSSESGPAKGVIAAPAATHVCYCHSPMRYIWDHYHLYRRNAGLFARYVFPFIAHRMRQWDVSTAARVDHFVANRCRRQRGRGEPARSPVRLESFA